jgi:hypothetical protein
MNVVEQAIGFLGCRRFRKKLHFDLAELWHWLVSEIGR